MVLLHGNGESRTACLAQVEWLASAGYPASSHKGDVISGLAKAAALDDVTVYHAGTALKDGDVVTFRFNV